MSELFGVVVQSILQALGELLLRILLRVVAVVAVFALLTPIVFLDAVFGPGAYHENVVAGYRGVQDFLSKWGLC